MGKRIVAGVKIEVIPGHADLHLVTHYYKRRYNNLFICIIVSYPDNAWVNIVNYAVYLREKYGKNVDLKIVATPKGEFLRFYREDGVPIYISKEGRIYVSKSSKDKKALINVAVRYLCESCGYRVKEKLLIKNWL